MYTICNKLLTTSFTTHLTVNLSTHVIQPLYYCTVRKFNLLNCQHTVPGKPVMNYAGLPIQVFDRRLGSTRLNVLGTLQRQLSFYINALCKRCNEISFSKRHTLFKNMHCKFLICLDKDFLSTNLQVKTWT